MADYSIYAKQAVTGETTKEYIFAYLVGEPSIVCAVAGKANPAFYAESIRRNLEDTAKAPRQAPDQTPETVMAEEQQVLATDKDLISKFCVRGWGKSPPKDATGKTPDFTPEEAADFLRAIPTEHFELFRGWVRNVFNFTPEVKIDGKTADAAGK